MSARVYESRRHRIKNPSGAGQKASRLASAPAFPVSPSLASRLWGNMFPRSISPDHARHILHFSLTVPRTSNPKGDRVEAEGGHVDGEGHRIPRFGEKTSPEPRLAGLAFWLEETLGPTACRTVLSLGLIPDTEVKLRQCVSGFQGGIPDPGGHSGS